MSAIIQPLDNPNRKKCGMKTEIFSRVCGYHRPVKNWNKGKQSEFKDRKEYIPELKKKGKDEALVS